MKSVNFEISGRFFSYCCVLVDFVSIALESLFEAFRCAECRMPKKNHKVCPLFIFPAPADRNCDRFVVQHLEYSLRGCLSHVFTHVDVTPLPCACLNQQRDGDRHLA